MKLSLFPFLTIVLLSFSCEKKVIERRDSAEIGMDKIEAAFSESTFQLSTDMSGHQGSSKCLWWGTMDVYSWTIDYRFGKGFESNGRAFYPIEKKWDFHFNERRCCEGSEDGWTKSEDWFKHDRLYRYDHQNKKAMIYKSPEDKEPETIMDFDLEVGDYWVVDDEYELLFHIDAVEEFQIGNSSYPLYKGHYSMNYRYYRIQNNSENQAVYLSPFNPNPFKMLDDFKAFETQEWSVFQQSDERQPSWFPEKNTTIHFNRFLEVSNTLSKKVSHRSTPSSYTYY